MEQARNPAFLSEIASSGQGPAQSGHGGLPHAQVHGHGLTETAPAFPEAKLKALPPFPEVARRLLGLVDKELANIQDVSRLIRSDAVFAGEVLRLANSAIFGLRHEVVSILHAISVLGMDRLRGLVLTVGLRDFVSGRSGEHALKQCWRHNLACALVAEWAAEGVWIDKSQAYTAGLLHGLGHFALAALDPKSWLSATAEPGRDLLEKERSLMGVDHVAAAEWLVREWKLPETFVEICRCDHAGGAINPTHAAGLAELACTAADMLGFPIIVGDGRWNPEAFLERLPEKARARLQGRVGELPELIPYRVNVFELEFLR